MSSLEWINAMRVRLHEDAQSLNAHANTTDRKGDQRWMRHAADKLEEAEQTLREVVEERIVDAKA